MRISSKLGLAVGATTLVVAGLAGVLGARAEVERFEEDMRRDQLAMGVIVARAIEHVSAREGPDRARALVADLNGREPDVEITWLEDVHPRAIDAPSSEIGRLTAEPELVSVFPVASTGGPPTALRLAATLRGEPEVARAAYLRALVVAVLVALLSTIFVSGIGSALVARRLRALGILARRVGGGDLGARAKIASPDEIGELAREMNAMGVQLETTQARLEEASADRIAVLEALRHADRLRVLGEIATEFAHQIGTPLAAVRTRAQLLGQGEMRAAELPSVGRAMVADVDRVAGSVRQMLDFARRRAGPKEEVDVGAWATEVLEILRPLTGRRKVALELRRPSGTLRATLASIEMQQVLTNLVMNALQASREGGRVVVTLEAVGDAVQIAVQDDGAGISEDALPHVFEPYFTTKQVGEGTGLGLSVAHGIVREHGGTIEIESALGAGTTVTVRIPRGTTDARPARDGKASWKARVGRTGTS